jgi:lycopene cyclase domain-containing protein
MPEPYTYLVLELGWALPPIFLQWFVGWQFLWRQRRAWGLAILLLTVYLSLADSTALGTVWTIAPEKSLGRSIGNVPLEEIVFFLLTNTLVVQSVILLFYARELSEFWLGRVSALKLSRAPARKVPFDRAQDVP